MPRELARYESDGHEIVITDVDLKKVLTTNQNVTDAEAKLFIWTCKANGLNPFIKECYLVKYGNSPATIIVSKDTFLKRATRNSRFKGYQAGLTVLGEDGKIIRREGSLLMDDEALIGAWCSVYVSDYEHPMYDEVSLKEYDRASGKGQKDNSWNKMPATMIRKVAICHALREAFPEDLGGLYGAEEMGVQEQEQPAEPIEAEVIEEDAPLPSDRLKESARHRVFELVCRFEQMNDLKKGDIAKAIAQRTDNDGSLAFYLRVERELKEQMGEKVEY